VIQSRSGRNGYQLEITLTSTHKIVENCILAPFNMCYFSLKALNKNVLWVNIDKEAINESYLSLHITNYFSKRFFAGVSLVVNRK